MVSLLNNYGKIVIKKIETIKEELQVAYSDFLPLLTKPFTLTNMVMPMKIVLKNIIWLKGATFLMMIVLCRALYEGIRLLLKRLFG